MFKSFLKHFLHSMYNVNLCTDIKTFKDGLIPREASCWLQTLTLTINNKLLSICFFFWSLLFCN